MRTLQYYDEIGLLKPSSLTESGYRLYDDASLETLQQILFFKELDFSLKDIKRILEDPLFDKKEAVRRQKQLLKVKRDRLNRLLKLLDQLEKGDVRMSFKEFDLSEYIQELEKFKQERREDVIRCWGSIDAYEDLIKRVREDDGTLAKEAVKAYGSLENYVGAVKNNLANFSENMEKMECYKKKGYVQKNEELHLALFQDITREATSSEVQEIIDQMMKLVDEEDRMIMNPDKQYWSRVLDGFLHHEEIIAVYDKKYGTGSAAFYAQAVQYYLDHRE